MKFNMKHFTMIFKAEVHIGTPRTTAVSQIIISNLVQITPDIIK